jgi:glutathione synthase
MRMLFVADPFLKLNPCHDSTVAMMEAAIARGHEVWGCTASDLGADHQGVYGDVYPILLKPAVLADGRWQAEPDWIQLGETVRLSLREFSTIAVRTDPPVDEAYLRATYILDHVDPTRSVVINRPSGLRNANEKLYTMHFRDVMPRSIVTSRRDDLIRFTREHGTAVVKPTGGMAGRGIMILRDGDPNLISIIDSVTTRGADQVMAQEFLPGVDRGDRRVILVDGQPVGAVVRVATGLDFRCNMATGGAVQPDVIDEDVERIVAAVGDLLRRDGLWFVGLDVIAGKLTEVNVTSPTGLREIQALSGIDVATQYIEFNETLVERLRR